MLLESLLIFFHDECFGGIHLSKGIIYTRHQFISLVHSKVYAVFHIPFFTRILETPQENSQQSINIFLTVFDSRNTSSEFVFVSKRNDGMTNWGKGSF